MEYVYFVFLFFVFYIDVRYRYSSGEAPSALILRMHLLRSHLPLQIQEIIAGEANADSFYCAAHLANFILEA